MSKDISFLLEFHDPKGWQSALHVSDRVKGSLSHLGVVEVCWWPVRSRPTSLFFGDQAVIPLNHGLPDDLSPRVYEYVRDNFVDDSTYAGWILLPDLDLGSWHRRSVVVSGRVPVRYANLFGNGSQPPPIAQLRQLGITDPVLERLTGWQNDRKSAESDIELGHIQRAPADSVVEVTWTESLVDYVGCIWDEGLSGLVEIPSPERYRIVTSIG